MYQDDYVLRHIRIFVKMIARVLGLIEEGDTGLALEMIDTAWHDYLGMSVNDFLGFPPDKLRDFLTLGEQGIVADHKLAFAASLLLHGGLALKKVGQLEPARVRFARGLDLLLALELDEDRKEALPEPSPSIDEFLEAAAGLDIGSEVLSQLVLYFEKNGRYAIATRILQQLIDADHGDPDTVDFARSFYDFVLDESDQKLHDGGVTRGRLISLRDALPQ